MRAGGYQPPGGVSVKPGPVDRMANARSVTAATAPAVAGAGSCADCCLAQPDEPRMSAVRRRGGKSERVRAAFPLAENGAASRRESVLEATTGIEPVYTDLQSAA
jgi:hypothetical protein